MASLRDRFSAPEILGMLARLAGLQPQPTPVTAQELLPLFSWKKVPVEDMNVTHHSVSGR
jgi:glutamyl-tRNA synthetase